MTYMSSLESKYLVLHFRLLLVTILWIHKFLKSHGNWDLGLHKFQKNHGNWVFGLHKFLKTHGNWILGFYKFSKIDRNWVLQIRGRVKKFSWSKACILYLLTLSLPGFQYFCDKVLTVVENKMVLILIETVFCSAHCSITIFFSLWIPGILYNIPVSFLKFTKQSGRILNNLAINLMNISILMPGLSKNNLYANGYIKREIPTC